MSVGPVPDIAGGVVVAPLGAASCPSGVVGPGGDDRRRVWALDGSPPSCGSGNGGGPGDGAGCGCSGAGGGSNGPMPWQWDFHALGGGGSGVRYPDQAGAWPLSQCPPPPGLNPDPVPGTGAPYSQFVSVFENGFPGGYVSGAPVTCNETGVTLSSDCSGQITFAMKENSAKTYRVPGGAYLNCTNSTTYNYQAGGGGPLPPPFLVSIGLNK